MNKTIITLLLLGLPVTLSMQAKTTVVYTGEIAKKVIGYNGPTPLTISIDDGKITKIEAGANKESPAYFNKAKAHMFPQYIGKTVKAALNMKPDMATGATYSSKAIAENMELGLKQAQQQKSTTSKKSGKKSSKKSKKSTRK